MLRVVVCVSGGGTNLQAILDAIDKKEITNTEIIAVISNNAGAKALTRAENHGICAICMSPKSFSDRAAFNRAFTEKMCELNPDLIVLAGFLVRIPEDMEVIGYNNSVISLCTEPELTSIDSKVEELSSCAVSVLMKVLSGEDADNHSVIAADIIKRNTTIF